MDPMMSMTRMTHDPNGMMDGMTHDPNHMMDGMTHDPNHMDGMTHDPHHNMDGMGHGASGHHMATYFFFGVHSVILFKDWVTDDWGSMLGACFAIGSISMFHEFLKVFRETLLRRQMRRRQEKGTCNLMCSWMHLLQTLLHMVQATISLSLMLVFMTFNVWLCIAVVVGAGIGYLLWGWKRVLIMEGMDSCH